MPARLHRHAFSLVEVVLALGVVSFAFVGIIGLLPVGLQTSRQAQETSVQSQIAQQVSNEIQLARFSDLNASVFPGASFPKYFDEQGLLVENPEAPNCVYTVNVLAPPPLVNATLPGAGTPNTHIRILTFGIEKSANPGFPIRFSVMAADNGL